MEVVQINVDHNRMYPNKFPEVGDVVVIKVKNITDMVVYVTLLEYGDIEGMILFSNLSKRRIKSVSKVIHVGQIDYVHVIQVDSIQGHVDLSKKSVLPADIVVAESRWTRSKTVHSILFHVSRKLDISLEKIYAVIGWPLYEQYSHAHDAFMKSFNNPTIFDKYLSTTEDESIRTALLAEIVRKLTPPLVQIKAAIELSCFEYDGINAIKTALAAGHNYYNTLEASETTVSIILATPPLYIVSTLSSNHVVAIEHITKVCDTISTSIKSAGGDFNYKMKPHAVFDEDNDPLKNIENELCEEE